MALSATGQTAFDAMKTAEDAASDAYFAANEDSEGRITQAQQPGLVEVIRVAGLNALFTHLIANIVVATVTAGTATGAVGGGPGVPTVGTGTGTIT